MSIMIEVKKDKKDKTEDVEEAIKKSVPGCSVFIAVIVLGGNEDEENKAALSGMKAGASGFSKF